MSINNPTAGSVTWFARHEFNLAWRDFIRMMSAGRPGREKAIIGVLCLSVVVIHTIAFAVLKPLIDAGLLIDKTVMAVLGGTLVLTFSLMMSQAMELVTRVFYSRSDLDLILSSPVAVRRLFAVRILSIAIATSALSVLLFGPAIHVLSIFHSPQWLFAYLVIFALGAVSTGLSLAIVVWLFDVLGAKATRLLSQIIAAIVGAGFIIGIQLAAIMAFGSVSRFDFLASDLFVNLLPDINHPMWYPVRGMIGDHSALLGTLAAGFGSLGFAIYWYAGTFGERVIIAASISQSPSRQRTKDLSFRSKSTAAVLRQKEWKLLLRDHWLISQSLMQILYLIPPAFMLWQGFGSAGTLAVVALPVLVMASGQLAGGLAWLAISGEDAPQLVQTAPVPPNAIIRCKVEAVLGAIAIIVLPIVILIALFDPTLALFAAGGIAVAAVSATMIQLWFRSQAKRSSFRRRQTSSKVATLAEAFSSILWAATTGLLAAGSWILVPFTILLALLVLWIARSFRPVQEN